MLEEAQISRAKKLGGLNTFSMISIMGTNKPIKETPQWRWGLNTSDLIACTSLNQLSHCLERRIQMETPFHNEHLKSNF